MKGQTLIELLVALGIASIVMVAATVAVLSSLSSVQYSRSQNLATQYAQEAVEYIRQLRDSGETPGNGSYCLGDSFTFDSAGSCGNGNVTNGSQTFKRLVQINNGCGGGDLKVIVTVGWSDGACVDAANPFCHQSQQLTCMRPTSSSGPEL